MAPPGWDGLPAVAARPAPRAPTSPRAPLAGEREGRGGQSAAGPRASRLPDQVGRAGGEAPSPSRAAAPPLHVQQQPRRRSGRALGATSPWEPRRSGRAPIAGPRAARGVRPPPCPSGARPVPPWPLGCSGLLAWPRPLRPGEAVASPPARRLVPLPPVEGLLLPPGLQGPLLSERGPGPARPAGGGGPAPSARPVAGARRRGWQLRRGPVSPPGHRES